MGRSSSDHKQNTEVRIQETGDLLKNFYERHCERQSLEAISALASLLPIFLDCFVVLAPRKDKRKHIFNPPRGAKIIPASAEGRAVPLLNSDFWLLTSRF
jgi:hypothetical protein